MMLQCSLTNQSHLFPQQFVVGERGSDWQNPRILPGFSRESESSLMERCMTGDNLCVCGGGGTFYTTAMSQSRSVVSVTALHISMGLTKFTQSDAHDVIMIM